MAFLRCLRRVAAILPGLHRRHPRGRAGHLAVVAAMLGVSLGARAAQTIPLAADRQIPAQAEAALRFDLPALAPGTQVRLVLDARIEWESLGGSTFAVTIEINGQGLPGRHLLNKPLAFAMRNDDELTWAAETGHGYRLMYSPDFSDRIATDESYEYGIPDTDPFHFVWDITPYVRAGSNEVNFATLQGMSLTVRLRNVAVEVGEALARPAPPAAAPPATATAAAGALPVYVPHGPVRIADVIGVSSAGRLRFTAGGRRFLVHSRTSLPQGQWSDGSQGTETWRRLRRGKTFTCQWTEAQYTVARRVTLHPDHIAVADTLRNTGDALVGLIHEIRLDLPEPPQRMFLAGNVVRHLRQRSSPAHPTALAEFDGLVLGLVAEDDIFRVHSRVGVTDDALLLADPQLGIAPGQAHTLEWSIYLVPGGDYWDVVNAIRRNWGSNVTLRGPSRWVHPAGVPTQPEAAGTWLDGAGMVILCNPTFGTEEEKAQGITLEHGTALPLCQAWCEQAAAAARALRAAVPTVEPFIYTHQNLCTEPGHENKYSDSRARDPAGKPATTVYSPSPSLFIPTLEDSYGQALLAVYRLIVERLDANVYIDEITASNVPPFGAYAGVWDGCTATVDPASHAVTGQPSSAILLMQPWRAALLDYLTSHGKTVIANGPPYTRTMLKWPVQYFVESEPEDRTMVGAHLGHPLCLAQPYNPEAHARYAAARRLLDRGGIQFVWFSAAAPVFPLTPIELRPGVVIAEERILTNRSGRFGWGDGSTAEAYVFDATGARVATPDARPLRRWGKALTELHLPADHLAILVRQRQ
jgi:hypothetical protein